MKFRYILILLPLVIFLLGPADLLAQEERPEISVTAGSMRTMPNGTIVAEGDVVVRGQGVTVRADNLQYDSGSDSLLLTGNVIMEEDGGGAFTGDALVLDLEDLTGGISRGEIIIVPNGFRVRGEDIIRMGPEEYSIRKGVFTSCPGDCPDWSFTASRIQVRKEGYLEARHAAFRIVGIPVFYTPYLLYPVKAKRQTGLLFPEFGFSDETGFESAWPFFITLGTHADATVTPRTFSRDSSGLDLESRYRLNWGGGGQINGFAMTGERSERWYLRAEHSMALTPDLWLRGRLYDAGEPNTSALFGDTFDERYPGAVYRHLSLEGDHGILGYIFQTSSFLTDGSLAGSDIPGTILERDLGIVRVGPGGGDLWRVGVEAEETHFDDGESRTLVRPTLTLLIPGPGKMSGHIQGQGIIGTGGDGSTQDDAYLVTVAEKIAMESLGNWGRHRIGLELTASASQSASFGGSVPRDSRDLVEERRILDARVHSLLTSSRFRWDLTVGSWRDYELDQALIYGMTSLSYSGMFLKVTRNQDADFGLVLPSIAVDEESLKGWNVKAGYDSDNLGIAVARDSTVGLTEMFTGKGYFKIFGIQVSGETFYDMDADTVADGTVEVEIPGRCWTVTVGRSRSPDRTDWKLQLELGI